MGKWFAGITAAGVAAAVIAGGVAHAGTVNRKPVRVYELAGRPQLGRGYERVTVRMPAGVRDVIVYADSADGQDETFAAARADGRGEWTARLTFTRADEPGRWHVVSTVAESGRRIVQVTSPTPAFTVGR